MLTRGIWICFGKFCSEIHLFTRWSEDFSKGPHFFLVTAYLAMSYAVRRNIRRTRRQEPCIHSSGPVPWWCDSDAARLKGGEGPPEPRGSGPGSAAADGRVRGRRGGIPAPA